MRFLWTSGSIASLTTLQGTVRPVPKPDNSQGVPWQDMPMEKVPLPVDPAVIIGGFDNIMVTLVSPDNGKPHNERAKVLDCRLHQIGRAHV